MIIAIRRVLGLSWLDKRKARQVRELLVTLKQKMDNPACSDYTYETTFMCCTLEGGKIKRIIGSDNMKRLNLLFNEDLQMEYLGREWSKNKAASYPVATRHNYFFGTQGVQWFSKTRVKKRHWRMAQIRKQLLDHWCKTLIGETL